MYNNFIIWTIFFPWQYFLKFIFIHFAYVDKFEFIYILSFFNLRFFVSVLYCMHRYYYLMYLKKNNNECYCIREKKIYIFECHRYQAIIIKLAITIIEHKNKYNLNLNKHNIYKQTNVNESRIFYPSEISYRFNLKSNHSVDLFKSILKFRGL